MISWPNTTGTVVPVFGNSGIAAATLCSAYSIGYMSSNTALQYELSTTQFVNSTTGAIEAALSMSSIAAAAEQRVGALTVAGSTMAVDLVNEEPPAYPIAQYTYFMYRQLNMSCERAYWMQKYMLFILDSTAETTLLALGFTPMSTAVKQVEGTDIAGSELDFSSVVDNVRV